MCVFENSVFILDFIFGDFQLSETKQPKSAFETLSKKFVNSLSYFFKKLPYKTREKLRQSILSAINKSTTKQTFPPKIKALLIVVFH